MGDETGSPGRPAQARASKGSGDEDHPRAPIHVLVFNQYYPPDTSATANMARKVVRSLSARHRVTVLAGRPSYAPEERHPPYLFRRERREESIVVERVGSTAFSRHRMPARIANYLSYLALAVPRALFLKPDLILAMTDPPVAGITAALVGSMRDVPIVYNIRDLHPDMVRAAGMVPDDSLWVRLWDSVHRWALGRADRVVVLGEDMRDLVLGKGVDPGRVRVVRDGAQIPERVATRDHPVCREIRGGCEFAVVHAGNLGHYGAWESLIEAARHSPDGVDFIFVGDGAEKGRLESLASGCPRVRFLPFRPREEVPQVLAAGDLQVVALKPGLEGVVVPSKLYPILAQGRPVLAVASDESDVARIVRETGCGVVVDPDEPEEIAATVRNLKDSPTELARMAERARSTGKRFQEDNELLRLRNIVEEAARTGVRGDQIAV